MNYDQIWKYRLDRLPRLSLHGLEMPTGAKFLSLQIQDGCPCLWMKVNSSQPMVSRSIYAGPTGKQPGAFIPSEDHADYIGTLLFEGGSFVGHFFLEKEEEATTW